jgi:glycosyltransferase involved in cell wall biosynthesis
MYPRFSETFIVNEILAHEAAGLPVEIFSLRLPSDGRFHENYARVQAPVTYLTSKEPRAGQFWQSLEVAGRQFPALWNALQADVQFEALDICQAFELAHLIRQQGVTHLHAHFASVATSVAWLASRLTGVPFFFTAHAKDIYHDGVSAADLHRKLADASAVITVSDYNVTHLQQHFGAAAARVHRIYNGLMLEQFPFCSPRERPPRIVAVGRLVEKKGFDRLIDACAQLAQHRNDFVCEIIGTGEEEAKLRARIQALGLTEHVQMLGAQPQSEVVRSVQAAAVFAAPCVVGSDGNRDGLPTVLLEAMALGTPCVATDVTGIPEVLRHNQTGLMVPQHDPHTLALALTQLLDDPGLRCRLARSARGLIESSFDVQDNTARIRDLYRTSLGLPALHPVAEVLT